MSTCADVGSFIESKTSVVQTSNVGFTFEVSDYLVVHMGPDLYQAVTKTVNKLQKLEGEHLREKNEHDGKGARRTGRRNCRFRCSPSMLPPE